MAISGNAVGSVVAQDLESLVPLEAAEELWMARRGSCRRECLVSMDLVRVGGERWL